MKVLLDANILIDLISHRNGFYEDARRVFDEVVEDCMCTKKMSAVVAVHTVSTVFYVLKKCLPPDELRDMLYDIFNTIDVGSANIQSVQNALMRKDFSDFEDALQYECALDQDVDCIVTRNRKDFGTSSVPVYTPKEFLAIMGNQNTNI